MSIYARLMERVLGPRPAADSGAAQLRYFRRFYTRITLPISIIFAIGVVASNGSTPLLIAAAFAVAIPILGTLNISVAIARAEREQPPGGPRR
jgi:hypothetical protein